jgi:hypothetical protein
MANQDGNQRKLDGLKRRLDDWREEYGGPGRVIPEEFWSEAAASARVLGVGVVARALRLDRARLAGEAEVKGPTGEPACTAQFVEVDASRVCGMPRALVRFEAPDGERVEIEISDATALEVVALASAFWSRSR